MVTTELLSERNRTYPTAGFDPALRMMPSLRTIVVGCVDPRVEPAAILRITTGEVAVLRNVGGRVTPHTLEELAILRAVTQAAGGDLDGGWELVVLQHTDCGVTRLGDRPRLMADYLGVDGDSLEHQHVEDPRAAVGIDVEKLRRARTGPGLGSGVVVSGLVYDVATGRVETVVAPG